MSITNPERASVGVTEASGNGGRFGRGRGGEVALAEHPDPSPRRQSKHLTEARRSRLYEWLEKWGIFGQSIS